MTRRCVLGLLVALALTTPALADDVNGRKQAVDSKIDTLNGALTSTQQREAELRSQIEDVTSRLRSLEAQVGDVSLRLQTLETDLALHRKRLAKLNELFHVQTKRLLELKKQYEFALDRQMNRLVAIYESDDVSTLDVVLGSATIEEALDKADYLTKIGEEDRRLAAEVAASKRRVAEARAQTAELRRTIQGETHAIAARANQVRQDRDALLGAETSLAATRQQQVVKLSDLSETERAQAGEIDALKEESDALAAQIRAAQAAAQAEAQAQAAAQAQQSGSSDVTPSVSGLVWPVNGPVTSPFGWRWGRMHEGIDIGAAAGTPIRAAASGRVIVCGWVGGYGNLVVIDHGGSLATAYGHQSAIAVTCGQEVSQGDVIGYVGCTGHCFGPHLHFEVRVNGAPVDPLGYL